MGRLFWWAVCADCADRADFDDESGWSGCNGSEYKLSARRKLKSVSDPTIGQSLQSSNQEPSRALYISAIAFVH